jgi:hypothetical protein
MDRPAFIILLSILIIGIALASRAWSRQRAANLLTNWVAANGYQLLRSEPRYLRTGPYFWRHARGQLIFYIDVIDVRGSRRSGYARLGGWFMGLLSDQVDVTWDAL